MSHPPTLHQIHTAHSTLTNILSSLRQSIRSHPQNPDLALRLCEYSELALDAGRLLGQMEGASNDGDGFIDLSVEQEVVWERLERAVRLGSVEDRDIERPNRIRGRDIYDRAGHGVEDHDHDDNEDEYGKFSRVGTAMSHYLTLHQLICHSRAFLQYYASSVYRGRARSTSFAFPPRKDSHVLYRCGQLSDRGRAAQKWRQTPRRPLSSRSRS